MLEELPLKRWRDCLKNSAKLEDPALLCYINDPFGLLSLREAIAGYLARSRFINCSPEQIAVFTSTEGGTDLLCRLLLKEGDHVAVENPGSPAIRLSFEMHGAVIHGIPVDEQGLVVDELEGMNEPIRIVWVTPSHHDPTGVVMSESRRRQLLEWAEAHDAFIIEDDFDSEFRYGDRPVAAMKGMDSSGSVIYRYNFWRVLFPMARIAFLVLPEPLASAVWRTRVLTERDVPIVEQRALADFINEGHLESHIRRTKALYARRRAALVQSLSKHFGKRLKISPLSAGMHVLVQFSHAVAAEDVLVAARQSGLPLTSMAGRYIDGAGRNEFLVAFAHCDEHEFGEMVARFKSILSR